LSLASETVAVSLLWTFDNLERSRLAPKVNECFYEKVIKVKADVAASSYFSYIADPGVVGGELSRAGAVRKRSS
jgi:hypothetical protein